VISRSLGSPLLVSLELLQAVRLMKLMRTKIDKDNFVFTGCKLLALFILDLEVKGYDLHSIYQENRREK
jgi:hypothetical protein